MGAPSNNRKPPVPRRKRSPQPHSPTSPPVSAASRTPQKWEPMSHGCSVCSTKTTSSKFKRTCFNKHEVVCERYHKTLLRPGRSTHCAACVMETDMLLKRLLQLEELQAKLEEGGKGTRKEIEELVRRYRELEEEIRTVNQNTARGLEERREGFKIWKSS